MQGIKSVHTILQEKRKVRKALDLKKKKVCTYYYSIRLLLRVVVGKLFLAGGAKVLARWSEPNSHGHQSVRHTERCRTFDTPFKMQFKRVSPT